MYSIMTRTEGLRVRWLAPRILRVQRLGGEFWTQKPKPLSLNLFAVQGLGLRSDGKEKVNTALGCWGGGAEYRGLPCKMCMRAS